MRRVLKIFGPPGTGKTHTLLRIVEKAISAGVPVERIAYITFTVRAQREAIVRAAQLLDRDIKELPYFRTLHSIAYRQLGITKSRLIRDARDFDHLSKLLHLKFKKPAFGAGEAPEFISEQDGDSLISFDHYMRHTGLSLEKAWQKWALESEMTMYRVKQFSEEYARFKENESLVDFTDLLEAPLEPLDVDVLIVDEAQDLSNLQWRALRRLAHRAKRIYIAGDDDQAIYTWAGASPDEFLAAKADRSQVLQQSFRVPRKVQALAGSVINGVKARQEKIWKARDDDGVVHYSPDVESTIERLAGTDRDTLILYRNHHFGKNIEELLQASGSPYTYADPDKVPAARSWIIPIQAWQRLQREGAVLGQRETVAMVDAIAIGKGITEETRRTVDGSPSRSTWTLEGLRNIGLSANGPWFQALTRVDPADAQYLRAILRFHGNEGLLKPPRIRISTIHAAKGAQADHVVLLTDMTRRVEKGIEENPDDERRVWYVGVTRARQQLTVAGQDHPFLT